jgi:hypothetical protein
MAGRHVRSASDFNKWIIECRVKRSAAEQQAIYWVGNLGPFSMQGTATIAWLEREVAKAYGAVTKLQAHVDAEKPTGPVNFLKSKLEQAKREHELIAAVSAAAAKGWITLTQEKDPSVPGQYVYLANRVRLKD